MPGGLALLAAAVTVLYFPFFTEYMVPKFAAVYFLAGLGLAAWLIAAVRSGQLAWTPTPVLLPMGAFLGVSLLSAALAGNRSVAAEALLAQAWWFVVYVLASNCPSPAGQARWPMWLAAAVAGVVATLGLLQYFGVHLIPLPRDYGNLPVATLGNTNYVAHYYDLAVPLLAGLLLVAARRRTRLLLALALAVVLGHLLVIQNRGGWLALMVAAALGVVRWRRRVPWRRLAPLGMVAGGLLAVLLVVAVTTSPTVDPSSLRARTSVLIWRSWTRFLSSFDAHEFSVAQRRLIWADTIDLVGDHPLLGVGPGNFRYQLPAYRTLDRHREWRQVMDDRVELAYQAHNEYLETMAQTGVVGAVAFVWLLAAVLWHTHRLARARIAAGSDDGVLTEAVLIGQVAVVVHALFSFNLQDPTSATHFWLLAGLVVSLHPPPAAVPQPSLALRGGRRVAVIALAGLAAVVGVVQSTRLLAADYYYFQGLWNNQLGYNNRAALAFAQATRWRGNDYEYYHMLGLAHLREERYPEAEAALRQSLALHPNNARALRLLGRAILEQGGRSPEAEQLFRRSIALMPLDPDGYTWLAVLAIRDGRHDVAAATFEQARVFWPDAPDLLINLGIEYDALGRRDEGVAQLERAVSLRPQDDRGQGHLGTLYLRSGRLADAEKALMQACFRAADPTPWRLALAQVFERQGHPDQALAQARLVLTRYPGHQAALALVRRLEATSQNQEGR
jgi:O-antigen ligase/Flp pilus assembly protein TadD